MAGMTRRSLFGLLSGAGAVAMGGVTAPTTAMTPPIAAPTGAPVKSFNWARLELFRRGVIGEVGEDKYDSWFKSIRMESLENGSLTVSVPVRFLKKWIEAHYRDALLRGAQRMDASVQSVEVIVRDPRREQAPC